MAVLTAQGSGKLAYSVLGEGVSCVPGAPGPGVTAGFPGGLWVGGFLELFGRPLCPAAGRTPGSGGEPPAATEAASPGSPGPPQAAASEPSRFPGTYSLSKALIRLPGVPAGVGWKRFLPGPRGNLCPGAQSLPDVQPPPALRTSHKHAGACRSHPISRLPEKPEDALWAAGRAVPRRGTPGSAGPPGADGSQLCRQQTPGSGADAAGRLQRPPRVPRPVRAPRPPLPRAGNRLQKSYSFSFPDDSCQVSTVRVSVVDFAVRLERLRLLKEGSQVHVGVRDVNSPWEGGGAFALQVKLLTS